MGANETKSNEWLLAYHGEAKNTGCISPLIRLIKVLPGRSPPPEPSGR